jgi:carboxyl-terminal processing protease
MVKRVVLLSLIFWVCLLGFEAVSAQKTPSVTEVTYDEKSAIKVFDKVWQTVNEQYYDPKFNGVDWKQRRDFYKKQAKTARTEQQLYQIMSQMVGELQDGHTFLITPNRFKYQQLGVLPSLGIQLRLVEDTVFIADVLANSPAAAAGLQKGWILKSMNGINANNREQINALLTGTTYGQTVQLQLLDNNDQPQQRDLTCCTEVSVPIEQQVKVLANNVVYLRFDRFNRATAEWVNSQISQNLTASGLVLDLRYNPGGALAALTTSLRLILEGEVLIGSYRQRKGKEFPLKVAGTGDYKGKLVVLIGPRSMSCSEMLAATVQELARGVVVGRRSSGVALVNYASPQQLPDGGGLQVTTGDYVTGKGRRLEKFGVQPDVLVDLQAAKYRQGIDQDLETALQILEKNKP